METGSELFAYVIGTIPVTWAPGEGEPIATQGGTPKTTWTWAVGDGGPEEPCRAPFGGGGLAVNRPLAPLELFRVPTPPPTTQEKTAPGTVLLYTSNATAVNTRASKGSKVTLSGEIRMRFTGPGETTTPPLKPVVGTNDARMRIVSAFVYVSVASVAVPPELIARLVVPRTPPPGVTPSRSRAARATVPVHDVTVAFRASFAVTVTENGEPAVAAADAVT